MCVCVCESVRVSEWVSYSECVELLQNLLKWSDESGGVVVQWLSVAKYDRLSEWVSAWQCEWVSERVELTRHSRCPSLTHLLTHPLSPDSIREVNEQALCHYCLTRVSSHCMLYCMWVSERVVQCPHYLSPLLPYSLTYSLTTPADDIERPKFMGSLLVE
jgi:hypothetical protein